MIARFIQEREDLIYRAYTTDALRTIAQNGGSYPSKRFAELLDYEPKDQRSGDEIVADVVARCGLVVK